MRHPPYKFSTVGVPWAPPMLFPSRVRGTVDKPLALGPEVGLHGSMPLLPVGASEKGHHLVKSTGHSNNSCCESQWSQQVDK